MGHTPGPWRCRTFPGTMTRPYVLGPPHPVDGGDYAPICQPDSDANARLIAAAPKLLEACKAVLEIYSDPCFYDHHGLCQAHHLRSNQKGEPECEVELLRKAINEAEGDE